MVTDCHLKLLVDEQHSLQLSEDELKQIQNDVHNKQIFLIVDESTLSGTQYLNILVGRLDTPHVSICMTVNL